ncbi:MAG: class I SAM-dependent methyltransferase [Myxococcota bacterium]
MTNAPTSGVDGPVEYQGWANRYDEDTRRFGWCAPQRVLDILDRAEISATRVLDLGVGTGQCSRPLLEAGASVVGIDAASAMLELATGFGYEALHEAKLGEVPLREVVGPGSFDAIVSAGVLHFVADLDALLAETAGLLSPGGMLCFTTIPPQTRGFSDATHVRSREVVQAGLSAAGLTLREVERFVAYYAEGDREQPVEYEVFAAVRAAVPSQPS